MTPPGTHLRPRASRFSLAAIACGVSMFMACAPEIGDECETALDCSSSGTRICDRTQPGGYCTLEGCEEGTCPEESVCVKFNPGKDRLSRTYCMYKCEDDSDCRDDEGYECLRARASGTEAIPHSASGAVLGMKMVEPLSDPEAFGSGLEAEVLDGASHRFCAVRSELPMSVPDAGMSMPPDDEDGGTSSGG